MAKWKRLLVVLLVLAMLVGSWLAGVRHLLENNNRRVELAVDAHLLVSDGLEGDQSLPEKLLLLQEAGCTAVAVSPLSLNELERKGAIISLRPALYLVEGGAEFGEQLRASLSPFLPGIELKKIRVRPATETGATDAGVANREMAGEVAVTVVASAVIGEKTAGKTASTAGETGGRAARAGTPGAAATNTGIPGDAAANTGTPGAAATIEGLSFEELTAAALHNIELPAARLNAGGAAEYQLLALPGCFAPAIKELPLLLPREQMLAWQRADMQVVPLFNYPARLSPLFSEKYWEVLARQLQELKHTAGIQFGPVVFPAISFSYPAPQGAAASIFKKEGLSLGAVEFTQGQGLHELAAALNYRLLRTHQIPGAELAQLGAPRARERFLRAVQERKVRLLLLQPFPELDPRSAWDNYLPFVRDLGRDLQKAGFLSGTASFFPDYQPPAAALALLGAGLAAAAILLAGFFFSTGRGKTVKIFAPLAAKTAKTAPPAEILGPAGPGVHPLQNAGISFGHAFRRNTLWLYPLAGTIFILATAGFLLAGERLPFYTMGKQLAALAAALIFPLLSTLFFLEPALPALPAALNNNRKEKETAEEETGPGAEEYWEKRDVLEKDGEEREQKENLKENGDGRGVFLRKLSGRFLLASLLTTGGALLAAGLLGSTPFLLKIESFRGVKIAQAGPFLLFALWLLLQGGQNLWRSGRNFLETRLQIKHLVLLALAGGILLIYFLRGGNTSFLPVSSWELTLRRQLEMLLVARPRFKEFLIGHPGFFLFAALAARHWRGSRVLALLLGLLGQISLFNTFMHLHRPVGLSLLGTVYGAGLGLLGGLVLYGLATAVARRWPAGSGGKK